MGTWSTGILADDDAQEVYEEFQRLFDAGKDAAAIRKKLERAWRPGADEDGRSLRPNGTTGPSKKMCWHR